MKTKMPTLVRILIGIVVVVCVILLSIGLNSQIDIQAPSEPQENSAERK